MKGIGYVYNEFGDIFFYGVCVCIKIFNVILLFYLDYLLKCCGKGYLC